MERKVSTSRGQCLEINGIKRKEERDDEVYLRRNEGIGQICTIFHGLHDAIKAPSVYNSTFVKEVNN